MRIYRSMLVGAAVLLVFSDLANAAVPNFPNGGVAVMHASGCTQTDYAAAADTNSARGTALNAAIAALANGDQIYLSAGTFNIGSNTIDLSKGQTISSNIHGAGKTATTITSSAGSGTVIFPGQTDSQTTDLAIISTNTATMAPWGAYNAALKITNGFVKNVSMTGVTDGVLLKTAEGGSTLTFINATISTLWDAMLLEDEGMSVNIYDSTITAAAVPGVNGGVVARAINTTVSFLSSDVIMTIYNTLITASGATFQNLGFSAGGGGEINLYGTTVHTSGGSQAFDLNGGSYGISPSTVYTTKHGATTNAISEVTEVVPSLPAETCTTPMPPSNVGISSIAADSVSQLTVTAQTATDRVGLDAAPYWFNETTGHAGATPSTVWQASTVFTDTGLSSNTQYSYQVKARNTVGNASAYSSAVSKYTLAPAPSGLSGTADSQVAVTVSANAFSNDTAGSSGYYFSNSNGHNSGWIQSHSWQDTGLVCGSGYTYSVKYRNGDGTETSSVSVTASTQACPVSYSSSGGNVSSPTVPPPAPQVSGCPAGFVCTPKLPAAFSPLVAFTRNLTIGSKGSDVTSLQTYLNMHGFVLAETGFGSPGHESSYFGPLTASALARFQKANGIVPSIGYFGPITRSALNRLLAR